jgi:beta-lactamase superfamily II metal-dependent hydrolase
MVYRMLFLLIGLLAFREIANAQANAKLQIHHMDVGQGDGAVLISPDGEVVLFDAGEDLKKRDCTKLVSYLDQLGVKRIDYMYVSHYHKDHIGCIPAVLDQFQLQGDVYDRGDAYAGKTFDNYEKVVRNHRKTAAIGDSITLDRNSQNPVVITVVVVNGKSRHGNVQTENENDLSLSAVVSFGSFREEIGGDLSGDNTGMYQDVEGPVAPDVGKIDVYKVHHHCSAHSTNDVWMNTTQPTVGIISTGDTNGYEHPAAECLERLHKHNVKTYWTEAGNGEDPDSDYDVVGGNIVVEVAPKATSFTVTYGGARIDSYPIAGSGGRVTSIRPFLARSKYVWSKNSNCYHFANCRWVENIAPGNLMQSYSVPDKKTLHKDCPR